MRHIRSRPALVQGGCPCFMQFNKMDLISLWKRAGCDYAEGIKLLTLYNPTYPLLPELLADGATAMNKIYLKAALKEFADVPPDLSKVRSIAETDTAKSDVLDRQIKELRHRRAKLHNSYFGVVGLSDEMQIKKRIEIDIELREVRQMLDSLYRQQEVFAETGELPTQPQTAETVHDFSNTADADLLKQRNLLRSRRSKARSNIKAATTAEKVEKYQQKLADIENELSYAEKEIARRAAEI